MRRAVASSLILALLGISSLVASLHTHIHSAHEHSEHQHGIAAHEHHSPSPHRRDTGPVIEACDPAQHVLAFSFVSTSSQQIQQAGAALVVTLPLAAPVVQRAVPPADVRVHGPPWRTPPASRAPPPLVLA